MAWRDEHILRTNYAVNPSYRYTSGTTAVRTNLCTNPSMNGNNLAGHGFWAGTGGAATQAWQSGTDTPRSVAGYGRITWSTAPSAGGGYASSISSITGGSSYTFSIYVRPSITCQMYPTVQWYMDNSSNPTTNTTGSVVTCPAGQWTRLSITSTAASTDSQYQFRAYVNGAGGVTAGTTIDYDDILVEQTDTLQPYFDGSSKVNLVPNPSQAYTNNVNLYLSSFDPAVSRTGALGSTRSDPVTSSPTLLSFYGIGGTGSGQFVVTPGVTYTFSCWIKVKCAVDVSSRIVMAWKDASQAVTTTPGNYVTTSANYSGWTLVTATATAPSDAATWYPSLTVVRSSGNSVLGYDTVWVTDALLEAGATAPGPFYQGLTPAWTGTPNSSTSILNGAGVLNGTAAYAYTPYGWTGWATGNNTYCVINPQMSTSSGLAIFSVGAASLNPQANPGDYWSGQFEARVVPGTSTDPVTLTGLLYGYTNSSTTGNTSTIVNNLLPVDGSWQLITAVSSAPMAAGTTNVRWFITVPTTTKSGTILEIRKVVTEKVSNIGVPAGPYFDGNMIGTSDISYRWTGTVDASASQQFIPAQLGLPQGYDTSIEHWLCDKYDLANYAFGITKVENSTPEVRGDFATIPQRNGVIARNNRSYSEGELSLSMWVVGCDRDGTVPTYSTPVRRAIFERNYAMLIKLLGAQNGPVTLQRYFYLPSDGYNTPTLGLKTTRALCTGSTSIDTMLNRQRAEMVFTFSLLDSFWTASSVTESVTGSALPISVKLTGMGNAPVDDSIITVAGPVSSPTVTCAASGVSFTYNGNLSSSQSLVVNSSTWDARVNGVSVISNMSHSGHSRFMYIPPRDIYKTSDLSGALDFAPTLVLSGAGAAATTKLTVQYATKYQTA